MRKVFSLLLVGTILYAQDVTGNIAAKFSIGEPDLSLFFLNPGYVVSSRGSGILGALSNPASLGFIEGSDISFAYSFTSKVSTPLKFNVEYVSYTGDTALLPIEADFTYEDRGGFDFVGVGVKFKNFAFGFATKRPSGIFFDGKGLEVVTFEADSIYEGTHTFTHDEIEDIPPDETIPVKFTVGGAMKSTVKLRSEAELSMSPLFLGSAFKLGPFSIGAGIKFTKYRARVKSLINFALDSLYVEAYPQPVNSDWNTDSLVVFTTIPADSSLSHIKHWGSGSGTQFSFMGGTALDLGVFGISFAFESGSKVTLKGFFEREKEAVVDSMIGNFVFDSTYSESVIVDPVNKVISGRARLISPGLLKESDYGRWDGKMTLERFLALRGNLRLFFLNFGASGEISLGSGDAALSSLTIYPHFTFNYPMVSMVIGGIARWRFIKMEGKTVPSVLTGRLGMGIRVRPPMRGKFTIREVSLAFHVDPLPWILSTKIEDTEEIEFEKLKPSFGVSFGIRAGLKL